jgi:hypothetical protein
LGVSSWLVAQLVPEAGTGVAPAWDQPGPHASAPPAPPSAPSTTSCSALAAPPRFETSTEYGDVPLVGLVWLVGLVVTTSTEEPPPMA